MLCFMLRISHLAFGISWISYLAFGLSWISYLAFDLLWISYLVFGVSCPTTDQIGVRGEDPRRLANVVDRKIPLLYRIHHRELSGIVLHSSYLVSRIGLSWISYLAFGLSWI